MCARVQCENGRERERKISKSLIHAKERHRENGHQRNLMHINGTFMWLLAARWIFAADVPRPICPQDAKRKTEKGEFCCQEEWIDPACIDESLRSWILQSSLSTPPPSVLPSSSPLFFPHSPTPCSSLLRLPPSYSQPERYYVFVQFLNVVREESHWNIKSEASGRYQLFFPAVLMSLVDFLFSPWL